MRVEDKEKKVNLTALIQGVGEGERASNKEVLDACAKVESTAGTLLNLMSSALSFVIPPARPKDGESSSR
jgi:hypothetical protein